MSNLPAPSTPYKKGKKAANEPPWYGAQTSQQKLDRCHKLLHLKPSIWAPFRALAEQTLLQPNSRADLSEKVLPAEALSAVVSKTTVSFLTTYGLQLFPMSKQSRTHLAAQDYKGTHFGNSGPTYLSHGIKVSGQENKIFTRTHGRQAEGDDEEIAFSRMGLVIQDYFKMLIELMWQADLEGEEELDAEESAAGEGEPEAQDSSNVPLTPAELVVEILAG